ncbi:MAG: two-component system NtrC family nitrogen regulation response regulator NtrX [Candidatus Saganbacteria bacterium]|uniref:Two-component system NtrC family nitrogen regulation response regulator NtrX n=1 Tax=Candidatus Saganbacteria bacterium TaxID=2575572 RepID=A0A833L1K0_UNCSA|nr:MAG: two-component system NtrC family nitrogen regulation response regulator NtrX [Candidatus Saganbacteria bacterium]
MSLVLVVDDEQSIRQSFELILSDKYKVITAASGEAAIKHTTDENPDLVFLDIRMPGMNGLETLKKIKEINPDTIVIMVTAVNEMQKANEAIKLGAFDYIVKPFDVDNILNFTANLLSRKNMLDESSRLKAESRRPAILGNSEKIEIVRSQIADAAKLKGGVIIIGPDGVEKEAVAFAIGANAAYDCRQPLPLLFGKSGGSTVADINRVFGAVDLASGGVLFIDHAELLPAWAQEQLLQYKDVRFILGIAQDLKETGFNQELQSSEKIIEIPPLKDRATDIPLIIDYYLNEANIKYYRNVKSLSNEAINLLSSYDWPGNVSQLRAVVCNMVMLSEKPIIEADQLPFDILLDEKSFYSISFEDIYSEFEKRYIHDVFKKSGQNKEITSKILGVSSKVLEAKL